MGCNGGQPAGAWHWFTKNGVSSGGDYSDRNSGATCKPYSMMSCAHHVDPAPGAEACDKLPDYSTPKCLSTCTDKNYPVAYKSDKHFAKSSYAVVGERNMQLEIMERGPISVALVVFEDFEAYSSGVYQYTTGRPLGGHAVKMIGWGVDRDRDSGAEVPYWICVNSWNSAWGEKGTFRILRGKNECGIETEGVAGEVDK
jgi:cathepsin B